MANWLNLEGKTVIVTGGVSGIGKAVVNEFLNQGCNVVVSDIVEEKSENPKLLYFKCDISNREEVENMVNFTVDNFGTVDVLINNAGINIPTLLVDKDNPKGKYELNDSIYNRVMDINVRGVYLAAQAVGRIFVEKGSGVMVNMSSESGLEGSEGQSIYAASKNAINSFTRSWAKELGKYGVRVVGVAPGILEATGLRTLAYEEALAYTRNITVDKLREGYTNTKTTPLGRDGKLQEVADLVAYISSDRASYIHGVTYNVAGGKTRG
ncbi:SDR family oxidoreductase [Gemella sp. GH3]|uniref:SDR family oxidoreductase n=1 Tax=unclassified Gemella TaxID=2624949 RepID=UPI0015D013DD|nr:MULTISPECIES: SDR family oxidoreductase [unclassified Gemella]MBF0713733.1 SDR family oxidoreductase [Gemella sp. GH3.1]NYS50685.1 SDR family oxidoreductase [Gemella sp. GH3]